MASKLRPALVALPLAALIALTGCTAQTIPGEGKSSPEASSSEKPSGDFVSAIPADELGLVLPGEEVITDAGSHRQAVLNRKLASERYLSLADVTNGEELKAAGYSDEDLIAAQENTYSKLIELNLDGPLFESDQTTLEWYEAGGEELFAPEVREVVHSSLTERPDEQLFVQKAFGAPLVADGDLRLIDLAVATEGFELQEFEGKQYILVNLSFTGRYRTSTDGILETLRTIEGPDYSRADMESLNPDFAADEATYTVTGSYMLSYGPGNFDQTAGMNFVYSTSLVSPEGAAIPLSGNNG